MIDISSLYKTNLSWGLSLDTILDTDVTENMLYWRDSNLRHRLLIDVDVVSRLRNDAVDCVRKVRHGQVSVVDTNRSVGTRTCDVHLFDTFNATESSEATKINCSFLCLFAFSFSSHRFQRSALFFVSHEIPTMFNQAWADLTNNF